LRKQKQGKAKMRTRHPFPIALAAASALMASSMQSAATEYAFSTYGLGGNAFGAGATPPPGTYVTEATAFYSASIGSTVSFGGVTLNPGAKVDAFSAATNILYVPERKVLGGNLGLSVTIPVGHIDVDATLGGPFGLSRSVDGWGFGDVWSNAIGPGLTYTTLLGQTPFILNVRHYHEFNAQNRWEGSSTVLSGTIRY
jgi:hypothetical protein